MQPLEKITSLCVPRQAFVYPSAAAVVGVCMLAAKAAGCPVNGRRISHTWLPGPFMCDFNISRRPHNYSRLCAFLPFHFPSPAFSPSSRLTDHSILCLCSYQV